MFSAARMAAVLLEVHSDCARLTVQWTPNKVTALRVAVGFAAVSLFGRGAWANLAAVALTVTAIALDALDGHIARKKRLASPMGAQIGHLPILEFLSQIL